MRTDREKNSFFNFFYWGGQTLYFRITKNSVLTASTNIQMVSICRISGFYREQFHVQRAKRQGNGVFFRQKARHIRITKKKTPLTAATHIQMEPICQILGL